MKAKSLEGFYYKQYRILNVDNGTNINVTLEANGAVLLAFKVQGDTVYRKFNSIHDWYEFVYQS